MPAARLPGVAVTEICAGARPLVCEIEQGLQKLDELKRTPNFEMPVAWGIVDAALHVLPNGKNATKLDYHPGEAQDLAIHIRGNPARTGTVVPRRFLAVLARDPKQTFRQGSGRLELANALIDDAGPLTARVMANRVWLKLMGQGIVPEAYDRQADRAPLDQVAGRLADLRERIASNAAALPAHADFLSGYCPAGEVAVVA